MKKLGEKFGKLCKNETSQKSSFQPVKPECPCANSMLFCQGSGVDKLYICIKISVSDNGDVIYL